MPLIVLVKKFVKEFINSLDQCNRVGNLCQYTDCATCHTYQSVIMYFSGEASRKAMHILPKSKH